MTDEKGPDLLYGFAEIGKYMGLTDRQVETLADSDESFPVFSIRRRRCALKSRLDVWLAAQADKAAFDRLADDGGRAE